MGAYEIDVLSHYAAGLPPSRVQRAQEEVVGVSTLEYQGDSGDEPMNDPIHMHELNNGAL